MNRNITRGELLLLIAVVVYVLSPIDAMPGLPFDDWAAVALAWLNRADLAPMIDQWAAQVLGGDK